MVLTQKVLLLSQLSSSVELTQKSLYACDVEGGLLVTSPYRATGHAQHREICSATCRAPPPPINMYFLMILACVMSIAGTSYTLCFSICPSFVTAILMPLLPSPLTPLQCRNCVVTNLCCHFRPLMDNSVGRV